MVEVAAIHGRANDTLNANYGYAGILVAFVARNNPLAIIPVAVLLGGIRASSGLLDAVYLHQFEDGTIGGVPGLVGKRLMSRDGYAGESVWYDALSPDPFVAKCLDPISDTTAGRCVRTVQLPSGLAAIYTFDATALPYWRQFDSAMADWLEHAGAI